MSHLDDTSGPDTLGQQTSANLSDGQEYVPRVETHLVASQYVKQTFKVQVFRPARKRDETTRFPVVYATDGNLTFDLFRGIAYLLQSSEQSECRFILASIGYPDDSPTAGVVLRARDLTFPGYPQLKIPTPTSGGALAVERGTKDYFGAEDFQLFIAEELIPLLDRSYETIPGDRTYFGHSAGAGFGLFTLFARTHLFKNFIISSPGLIYDGTSSAGINYENYDFLLQHAREFVASGKSLDGVTVYMSVGAEEEFEAGLEQWHLTSGFYRMIALMKAAAIPGLVLLTEVFSDETHATAWPIAFMHGVQAVFGTGVWKQKNPRRSV